MSIDYATALGVRITCVELSRPVHHKAGAPRYRVSGRPSLRTIRHIAKPRAGERTPIRARRLAGVLGAGQWAGLDLMMAGPPVRSARRIAARPVSAGDACHRATAILYDALAGEGRISAIGDARATHASPQWDAVLLHGFTADHRLLPGVDRQSRRDTAGCGPLSAVRVVCPSGHRHLSDPRCSTFGSVRSAIP